MHHAAVITVSYTCEAQAACAHWIIENETETRGMQLGPQRHGSEGAAPAAGSDRIAMGVHDWFTVRNVAMLRNAGAKVLLGLGIRRGSRDMCLLFGCTLLSVTHMCVVSAPHWSRSAQHPARVPLGRR